MNVDVTVVGSGPNGLAAAVIAARAGLSVRLIERAGRIGGGLRTVDLTVPGFHHDVCSAVHPMALASPFFRAWELERRVSMIVPDVSYGHPLDGGRAGIAWRDLDRAADTLGGDGPAWKRLFGPLVDEIEAVGAITGGTLFQRPRHLRTMMRLGLRTLAEGGRGWNAPFSGEIAPALFTGAAAHMAGAHPSLATASVGLVLATHGHGRGWPIPVGGSQAIADALAADLVAHGGKIVLGVEVADLDEVAGSKAALLDVGVSGLLAIGGDRWPDRYRKALRRYRYGTGICKVDFALSAPVPWSHPDLAQTATIHLGGTRAEIAAAERDVLAGKHPDRPYVLVTQPSLFDASRAPDGKHTLWAYTHVPRGSFEDRSEAIVRQIERFAPGFREMILAQRTTRAMEVATANPNYPGGDIASGEVSVWQLVKRPVFSPAPWRTPLPGVYLCSAATPPGPAVHGMGGYHAMRLALKDVFGIDAMPPLAPGT
ncbi:MAG: NAD(P)/FAD-dependent oxidoreductase [Thermomicrobiales bacterium]